MNAIALTRTIGATCLILLLWSAEAFAKKTVIVLPFGWGDDIIDVAAVAAEDEFNGKPRIGYKYDYVHLFWLSMWTWGGTFCLFEGNNYQPIEPNEASMLANGGERTLRAPLEYMIPPGLAALLVVCALLAVVRVKRNRQAAERVANLRKTFDDPRYHEAVRVFANELSRDDASVGSPSPWETHVTADDDTGNDAGARRTAAALEAAIQSLVDSGVPDAEARAMLPQVLAVMAQASQEEQAPTTDEEAQQNPSVGREDQGDASRSQGGNVA